MELVKKSSLYLNYLFFKNTYHKNKKFYKYSRQCEVLQHICRNKNKLTEELYALPLEIFYNNGILFGFSTEYLEDYLNIDQVNSRFIKYDRHMLINNIIRVIKELESIDLIYYDIHGGNFMINGLSDFKVIDLDGVREKNDKTKMKMLNNFMNFLLTIYFFSDLEYSFYTLKYVVDHKMLEEYFSQEVKEYFDYLLNSPKDIIDYDLSIIVNDIDSRFKDIKSKKLSN